MIELPIETERLRIRRIQPKDLDSILRFMLDAESTKYLAFAPEQTSRDGASALFEQVVGAYDGASPIHAYAIADRHSDRHVGSCGWSPYSEGVVECYYCVNAEERGNGLAGEATRALVQALSRLHEVRAYCHPDNSAAHRVARVAGMTHRGTARHANTGLTGELFVYVAESSHD